MREGLGKQGPLNPSPYHSEQQAEYRSLNMSRKPKGSGGRNGLTQDLIRDNLEDMDMDPYAPIVVSDDSAGNELYPQIAPPLSASLMSREAAFCMLKQACLSRSFKGSAFYTSKDHMSNIKSAGVYESMTETTSGYNSGSTGALSKALRYSSFPSLDAAILLKSVIKATSEPGRYFPEEIIASYIASKKSALNKNKARQDDSRGNGRVRPRSDSTGAELFGRLEKREKISASQLDLLGAGLGEKSVGTGDGDEDNKEEDEKKARGEEGAGEYSDEEDQEMDEYEMDDDYGAAHGMSDDDGGDDDDGEEPTF